MLRLEQLVALVVAAGLAIVSYLLFFSSVSYTHLTLPTSIQV